MPRFYLVEWDMDNGETLVKEPLEVKNEEEAYKVLEQTIAEAQEDGWDCMPSASAMGDYICTKCEEDGCVQRQVLIEVSP